MKTKHLILALCLLFTIPAVAQNELWEKYSNTESVTFVSISKSMIGMMPLAEVAGIDLPDLTKKIESMRVLSSDNLNISKAIYDDFQQKVKNNYEELMHFVRYNDKFDAYFYIRKKGDIIKEILMVSNKAIVQINGDFTLEDTKSMTAAPSSKSK